MAESAPDKQEVIRGLRYIADSPSQEHGGFHPEAVKAAKRAIEYIGQPAPEMDYSKEHELFVRLFFDTVKERLVVLPRDFADWLRTHDARVQQSSGAGTERLREALKQIAETAYDALPENLGTAMDKITEVAESALKESSR